MSRSVHFFQANSNSWDDYLSSSFSNMDPFSQGNSSQQLSENDSGYTTDDDEPNHSGYTTHEDEPNDGAPLVRCKSVRPIAPMRFTKERVPSDDSGVGLPNADDFNPSRTVEQRSREHLSRSYCRKSAAAFLREGQFQNPGEDQDQNQRLRNPELTINTNRNRGNTLATGLRGSHILSSFEPTSRLRSAGNQSSIERRRHSFSAERVGTNRDAAAARFLEIEAADERARKRILEGHLDKIFGMDMPPVCDLGAQRKVQFVNGTSPRGMSAEFADADGEKRGFRTFVRSRMRSIGKRLRKLNSTVENRGGIRRGRSTER